MTAAHANIFNLLVSDDAVRVTFTDSRPDVRIDSYGVQAHGQMNEVVAEVVMSPSTFKKFLDVGGRVLDEHEAKKNAN